MLQMIESFRRVAREDRSVWWPVGALAVSVILALAGFIF